MKSVWSLITEARAHIGDSVGGFFARLSERTSTPPEKTVAFTIGVIALGAKMARADGQVTGDEIKAFRQVFEIPVDDEASISHIFELAQQDVAGYETYAQQIAKLFKPASTMLENVLDGLFYIATSDGRLGAPEAAYLKNVATIFGFDEAGFEHILVRHVASGADDPYLILGLSREVENAQIKARYLQLVRDHHPDQHMAEGMPAEMVVLATERLAKINAAYDTVALERGL